MAAARVDGIPFLGMYKMGMIHVQNVASCPVRRNWTVICLEADNIDSATFNIFKGLYISNSMHRHLWDIIYDIIHDIIYDMSWDWIFPCLEMCQKYYVTGKQHLMKFQNPTRSLHYLTKRPVLCFNQTRFEVFLTDQNLDKTHSQSHPLRLLLKAERHCVL